MKEPSRRPHFRHAIGIIGAALSVGITGLFRGRAIDAVAVANGDVPMPSPSAKPQVSSSPLLSAHARTRGYFWGRNQPHDAEKRQKRGLRAALLNYNGWCDFDQELMMEWYLKLGGTPLDIVRREDQLAMAS